MTSTITNSKSPNSMGHGYNCEKCGKKFDSIVSRKLHSLDCTVNPQIPGLKKNLACPVGHCSLTFFTNERLALHLAEEHHSLCSHTNHDYGLREVYFTRRPDFTEWFSNICEKYEYTFVETKSPIPGVQCSDALEKRGKRFCPAFVKLKSEDNGHYTCTFSLIHIFHKFNQIPVIEVPKGNFCFVIKNKKQLPDYSCSATPERSVRKQGAKPDSNIALVSEESSPTLSNSPTLNTSYDVEKKKPEVRVENLWDMPALPTRSFTYPADLTNEQGFTSLNLTPKPGVSNSYFMDLPNHQNLSLPSLGCLSHNSPLQSSVNALKRRNIDYVQQPLIKRLPNTVQCPKIPPSTRDNLRKAPNPEISTISVNSSTSGQHEAESVNRKTMNSPMRAQSNRAYQEKRATLDSALNSMTVRDAIHANMIFNIRSTGSSCSDQEGVIKEKTSADRAAREKAARERSAKEKSVNVERNRDQKTEEKDIPTSQADSLPTYQIVRGSANQSRYPFRKLPNYVPAAPRYIPSKKLKVSPKRTDKSQKSQPVMIKDSDSTLYKPVLPLSDISPSTSADETDMQSRCQTMANIANYEMVQMNSIDSLTGNYAIKYQIMRNFHHIKEASVMMEMFTDQDLPCDNETSSLFRETEENMWRIIAKLGNKKAEALDEERRLSPGSNSSKKRAHSKIIKTPVG
ncbi:unnamed protein product [Auanema sp. JU1783]|nr:unnamed protein product [Auanema sp. JU1783]